MATLAGLKVELEPFKNTLVIGDFFEVVRLVDVKENEFDYYWVYDSWKGESYGSCAGRWIPLKGFIKQEDYERLLFVWNLNNIEKAI